MVGPAGTRRYRGAGAVRPLAVSGFPGSKKSGTAEDLGLRLLRIGDEGLFVGEAPGKDEKHETKWVGYPGGMPA